MKRKSLVLYIILVIFILTTNISLGIGKYNIPNMIKIGINHGNDSISTVNLYSNSGFEFGYYDNNIFNNMLQFLNTEKLMATKDFQSQSNNRSNGFHVQIGEEYDEKYELEEFLATLKSNHIDSFPAYENGWEIWTGPFSSDEEAEDFISKYKKIKGKKLRVIQPNNQRVRLTDNQGNIILVYNSLQKDFSIRPFYDKDGNEIINANGKRYRGSIVLKRYDDSDMTIINYLNLQEYLYGVLPKEMNGEWPLEALKAQAVAARNYAVANIGKHSNHGFDLCAGIDCQVYGGYDVEKPRTNRAVDETDGKVLVYDNKIISTFFHANSGGHTEDSENIWSISIPYIRGVKDDFSLDAPHSSWTKAYTKKDIKEILDNNDMNIGDVYDVIPLEFSENGRVLLLKIEGSLDDVLFKKEETRKVFGYYNIKSMWFNVNAGADVYIKSMGKENLTRQALDRTYIIKGNGFVKIPSGKERIIYNGTSYKTLAGSSDKVTFNGKGWGHGLGMSQWGAKKMAEIGYSYEEILKHYYRGTRLE